MADDDRHLHLVPDIAQSPFDMRRTEQAELSADLVDIPWCPWTPTERQSAFLLNFSQEVLYGGAVGGAKSVAILMAASQFLDTPGYAALLLRRSFADLAQPAALMDIAEQWWRGNNWRGKGMPRYDQQTHTWHFPTGSTVTFGYIGQLNDHLKYQGAAYQFVGFDEVTQHHEMHYTYLFSRLRRSEAMGYIPLRMRATANPGGPGHDWVFRRFIKPYEDYQNSNIKPKRIFIPSRLEDNPHLNRESYLATLAELDPVTRAQLLRGDWNIRPDGRMFKRDWWKWVDDDVNFHLWPRLRYWDMAATDEEPGKDPDWTVGALMAMNPSSGLPVLMDVTRMRGSPAKVEARMQQVAMKDGRGVPQYVEQEPGSSGKTVLYHIRSKVLPGFMVYGHKPSGSKVLRAGPLASRADAGDVSVVKAPWNETWLNEIELFPDGFHDDQVDATTGAYNMLTRKPRVSFPGKHNDDMRQINPWAMDVGDRDR